MNREILFRGQTPEGKWAEGFLCRYKIGELFPLCIQVLKEWDTGDYMEYYEVLPETVGQFTGKTDKNGKRVFKEVELNCQTQSYSRKMKLRLSALDEIANLRKRILRRLWRGLIV